MNRYRKLYCLTKVVTRPFISESPGEGCSVSHVVFNKFRCSSSLVESQPTDGSQTAVERNADSCPTGEKTCELPSKQSDRKRSVIRPAEIEDLSGYGSVLKPSFNFAAYADKSPLLQKLIELGVRLYEWEKKLETVEFILPLDFDKSIKPYLSFLIKNGVPTDKLGDFITRNPFIFKEGFDDLQVRINYLRSKKFDRDMIASIITRHPKWLSIPVKQIDDRLGYLQQTFNLKGDDVRIIIVKEPSLVSVYMRTLYLNVQTLKEEMDLDKFVLNKLVVALPHLLRKDPHEYLSSYDYLRRVMKLPQNLILKTPQILNHRKFKIRERHKFLTTLGKAQYNPLLAGYVPLSSFFELTDEEFCEKVAKTSLETYYEFLKTF